MAKSSDFKFELNYSGVGQMLKSSSLESGLRSIASSMQSRCGSGYEVDTYNAGSRVIASVATTDYESMRDNYDNNTLLKAMK